MEKQFYIHATSLNENLIFASQCFIKSKKSIRKYRKLFFSSLYLYTISQDKVKHKISLLSIRKVFVSTLSSQFMIICDDFSLIIDNLTVRQKFTKQIFEINNKIQIEYLNQTMLDDYLDKKKEYKSQKDNIINLVQLRDKYEDYNEGQKEQIFSQMYYIVNTIIQNESYDIMTIEERTNNKISSDKKKSKNKQKSKRKLLTAKIYNKKFLGKNESLRNSILRQRKCLQEILSPFTPVLYKCFYSQASIFCITEHYQGQPLQTYIQNQTLSKSNFKQLMAQIVIGLGQIHQCNFVYNNVNTKGIIIKDQGYLLFNDFSFCQQVGAQLLKDELSRKTDCPPEIANSSKMSFGWDWWNLGNMITNIKGDNKTKNSQKFKWSKQPQLDSLRISLLKQNPAERLGFMNDYHEIISHNYFDGINKKQIASQTCQPLKKFYKLTPVKAQQQFVQGQDWSIHDNYLLDYQFSRELQ